MNYTDTSRTKIRTMRVMLFFSILLMGVKFTAWYITGSNAILTDALESIINVTAGAFALFSISYALQPSDRDHPYGHGKMEFVSAGIEGGLILFAGLFIIGKAIYGFIYPNEIDKIDAGALLTAGAGACNFFMGYYLVRQGKKQHSAVMTADGKHLLSDTVSSVGLVAGLIIIHFTGLQWLDNVLALIFGGIILYMGMKIIRESVTSLLDEADQDKLNQIIFILNSNRNKKWIDIHNLRILKYGSRLHVDAHLTLPWYDTLEESHAEMTAVTSLVRLKMESEVEFFLHPDPCLPASCPVCLMEDCIARKAPFSKKIEWTSENILPDRKHTVKS